MDSMIDEAIEYVEEICNDPFTLADEMSDDEFREFIMTDSDPDIPEIHKRSILNLLNMILDKGGDERLEMIIYKALSKLP